MSTMPRPGRVLAAVAVIGLAVLGAGAGPTPAGAARAAADAGACTMAPGAAPSGANADDGAHIELRGQTAFVSPTDTMHLHIDISGAPETAGLRVQLELPITPQADPRKAFGDYLAGRTPSAQYYGRSPVSGAVPLAFTPRDAEGNADLALSIVPSGDAPELGFRVSDPGVYPLFITLVDPESQRDLDHLVTFLIRLPDAASSAAAPPLQLATIVPFRAPLAFQPDGSTVISDQVARCLDAIATVTRSHRGLPMAIAANPETIDALDTAPPAKGPVVADLSAAWKAQSILTTSFVPVDLTAWTNSNLEPELLRQEDLGAATLRDRLHPSAEPDRRIWFADQAASPQAVSALRRQGRDRVVLPPEYVGAVDSIAKPDASATAAQQPFDIDVGAGHMRAVTSDTSTREQLAAGSNPAVASQLALTSLALTWFGDHSANGTNAGTTPTPGAGAASPSSTGAVVLVLPETDQGLAAFDHFAGALTSDPAAGGAPIVRGATLDEVFSLPPATAKGAPLVRSYLPTNDPARTMGDFGNRLEDARFQLAGFHSMVGTNQPDQISPLEQSIDVSGDAQLDAAGRQQYLDRVLQTVQHGVEGVDALPQERVTLATSHAELKIPIENRNPYPVAVRVTLNSDSKLDFPDGKYFVSTLQPGTNRVPVVVDARSAGGFTVNTKIESPDQRLPIATSRFEVRSTVFSGLGVFVTLGAGFFLLVWWARNFRKSRRASKLVDRDQTSTAPPGSPDDGAPGPGSGDSGEPGEPGVPGDPTAPGGGSGDTSPTEPVTA